MQSDHDSLFLRAKEAIEQLWLHASDDHFKKCTVLQYVPNKKSNTKKNQKQKQAGNVLFLTKDGEKCPVKAISVSQAIWIANYYLKHKISIRRGAHSAESMWIHETDPLSIALLAVKNDEICVKGIVRKVVSPQA